ncbi:MAG: GlsB/YeaQ/YmgE family stress response membrane protein [Gemmataceae bacterium]|nr:GlsB/YeaQ/YmgE family stress response membrane protein [Gemmataceae bacterium]
MFSLIGWLIAGLIVGALARLIYPGRQPMGMFMTMMLGVVGALLGGFASWAIWGPPNEPFSQHAWPGYLMSIVGALIVLAVYLGMTKRESI